MLPIYRHTICGFTNAFGDSTKSICQPLQLHLRNKDDNEPFVAFVLINAFEYIAKISMMRCKIVYQMHTFGFPFRC